jgi:hypothetical protein
MFLLPEGIFSLHGVEADLIVQYSRSDGWRPGGWEIRSPGDAQQFPKQNTFTAPGSTNLAIRQAKSTPFKLAIMNLAK